MNWADIDARCKPGVALTSISASSRLGTILFPDLDCRRTVLDAHLYFPRQAQSTMEVDLNQDCGAIIEALTFA